ncbi:MAG TPA: DUF1569 domain-containing protein [Chitinophaga sp.]|uniref:DUF1569 domain-containing protein n=1 Tax=Chitinophaga sp. TaxID=1869181 RepID=UPI002C1D0A37|nr:DUF1569 domain-containing protein [Chitinophaga sp.]HVI46097.1 DUF1569 domain-containing protein [Chitinophaga sp.]
MKTIFDKAVRSELIERINSLDEHCKANWGKMNVYQMAKHCTIWNDWVFGKNNPTYKRDLLGRIFGSMALKSNTKDDRPMLKNMPTGKAFTVKGQGDVEKEKKIWVSQIDEYENYSNPAFIHDFFGKMTYEQIGILAYKHFDHHLRQFGA